MLGSAVMHYHSSIDPRGIKGPQDSQIFPNKVFGPQWRPLPESWLVQCQRQWSSH